MCVFNGGLAAAVAAPATAPNYTTLECYNHSPHVDDNIFLACFDVTREDNILTLLNGNYCARFFKINKFETLILL